ncbi:GH1 family beta-glucosidase [Ornithinimicrobium pekingense]|uniref:Beta-glucosidase n=1 Tax=Ornithinimicrobium pekingense TaxID=384677 RepID=A0ABQ2FEL2_9MICO|nr:GH1 family beta-glucosidase [Ornithinimicrobium pekingense]GGK80177.1 beta-glucosidase [Ornithinimicrobium pekingense]
MTAGPSLSFPPDFLWGAATASYQIEGAGAADGRGESIWDTFARVPGKVLHGHDGSVACDHYHLYPQDVALMRELNLSAYRFSLAWPRIFPDGRTLNRAGLDFYSRLVDELLAAGVTPWLTLYHWDLPQALEEAGGWPERDTALRFVDYAATVHDALGDRVHYWTTLNEPWCSAFLGYAAGVHAPGRTEPQAALRAAHHLLLGHGLATQELRRRDPSLSLGLTLNFTDTHPLDPATERDQDAARRIDGLANRFFVEPVTLGAYPADVLDDLGDLWPQDLVHDGDLEVIATPIDVLGVNYYATQTVTAGCPPERAAVAAAQARRHDLPSPSVGSEHVVGVRRGIPVSDMGWEISPDGLSDLLLRLHKDYTGPQGVRLVVTENGAAADDRPDAAGFVDDRDRVDYLDKHLRAVHDAVSRGADVDGYFVWSLLDNFEWAWGYTKRFGIVRVDYDTQERTPKASARWYADVAGSGLISGNGAQAPTT